MKSGIYTITNNTNGHRYVGSAVDINGRWAAHKSALLGNKHHSIYLQRAFNKYGEAAFKFEVLEHWESEFLIGMEQLWINWLRPEYNMAPVAGSQLGMMHTAEANAKNSAAHKGRKLTKGHKAKLSAAKIGNTNALGYRHTAKTKEKISRANLGNTHTLGHKHTAKAKAKMVAAWHARKNKLAELLVKESK